MINFNLIENKPTADILMTSMRTMGYSFESAIADVIDNSISAHAYKIHLKFPINPAECYVAICDNGCGMTREELFDAMKYGSEQKRGGRADDDLGRFGLGLKAASLSQCRKLTVMSKKDNNISAFVWDLDIIEEKKDWYIKELMPSEIRKVRFLPWFDEHECGTIVLWEEFDLIEKSLGSVYSVLVKKQNTVSEHLSLIFHRFLNGSGIKKIEISINNYNLIGLDPFLENHNKTNIRKRIEIPIEDSTGIERIVVIQPYVLPYQKYLSAEDKWLSGGIENYRSRQGFYIYRNQRLIVWGKWFGRHRDELTKHARIKVDIPNTLDDIWGIDIKKQSAEIPAAIKNRLTRAVDDAMDVAIKAQTYRGRIDKADEKIDFIWDRISVRDEQFTYRINRRSKIFELLRSEISDEVWTRIDMVLEEIENSVPYQRIYIDISQNRINETLDLNRMSEIEEKARLLISLAESMGDRNRMMIIEELFKSEPFSRCPELKDKL